MRLRLLLILLQFLVIQIVRGQIFFAHDNLSVTKLNVKSCIDTQLINVCSGAVNSQIEKFTDIAIDRYGNIYYIDGDGSLIKQYKNGKCLYLGSFQQKNTRVLGLVADSLGNLYAVASSHIVKSAIYKFDGTVFNLLGEVAVLPTSDLFFYKDRMFMTCYTNSKNALYEIDIDNPANSFLYMYIDDTPYSGYGGYASFSIYDGNKTRVFVSLNKPESRFVEIDIDNKKVFDTLCIYENELRGAASYYNPYDTTNYDTITVKNDTSEIDKDSTLIDNSEPWFIVNNPSTQKVRVSTNISGSDFLGGYLLDMAGKKIMYFSTSAFPDNLFFGDVPNGMYMLRVGTIGGKIWNKRVLVLN